MSSLYLKFLILPCSFGIEKNAIVIPREFLNKINFVPSLCNECSLTYLIE